MSIFVKSNENGKPILKRRTVRIGVLPAYSEQNSCFGHSRCWQAQRPLL